jgi:ferric-dicitrate binding protein FerR (iron transport regulator)
MIEKEPGEDKSDTTALWQVFQELEAGTLEPEERDELMALIERSPEARRSYLEYFEMSAMLEAEAAIQAAEGKLPIVESPLLQFRSIRSSILVAAAVLILGAIVAALIMVKPAEPRQLIAVVAADTKCQVNGSDQDPDANEWVVSPGSTLRVSSGTVKLRLESGAVMVMQGPARVSFPELDKPVLKSGWLWIDSGGPDESFEVTTPNLIVRDIGTRFGVRVPKRGPAEVHLIEGKVEVLSKSTQKVITTLEPENQGVSVAAVGMPTKLALARDPFPELEELLALPGNYATTVISQNPLGYWRLEKSASEMVINEVPDGLVGGRYPKVVTSEPGPRPESGFYGFGERNHAAQFSGDATGAPLRFGIDPNAIAYGFLAVDFQNGNNVDVTSLTQPGFLPFDNTRKTGAGTARATYQTSAGDVTVGLAGLDSMLDGFYNRGGVSNGGELTFADIYNDFAFKNGSSPQSLTLTVSGSGISPNTEYDLTFYALDSLTSQGKHSVVYTGTAGTSGAVDLQYDTSLYTTTDQGYATTGTFTSNDTGVLTIEMVDTFAGDMGDTGIRLNGIVLGQAGAGIKNDSAVPQQAARLPRKEGAVSFWMLREPDEKRKEVLWAAGKFGADAVIHTHLTASGAVEFFMKDGRSNILVTSKDSIADGQWHHIAASWNTSTVDLYVDGKQVDSTREFRVMKKGILSELRFGNGSVKSGYAPFAGSIDEIGLWNRLLTAEEVRHQFRSAKGVAPGLLPPED